MTLIWLPVCLLWNVLQLVFLNSVRMRPEVSPLIRLMLATSAETLSAKLANNCPITHHNKNENKTEETETLIAVMIATWLYMMMFKYYPVFASISYLAHLWVIAVVEDLYFSWEHEDFAFTGGSEYWEISETIHCFPLAEIIKLIILIK